MTSYTKHTSNNSASSAYMSAFNAAFQETAEETKVTNALGETWNGDINHTTLGDDFQAAMLELKQIAVRKVDPAIVSTKIQTLVSRIEGLATPVEQAEGWKMFFMYMVYLRQIRDGGMGERDLFYQIFMYMADKFPQTSILMLPLVWKYGYFKDITMILGKALDAKMTPLADACVHLFKETVDADLKKLFGKGLAEMELSELVAKKKELTDMSTEDRIAWARTITDALTLIGKWLPAEGKKADKDFGAAKLLSRAFFCPQDLDITAQLQSKQHDERQKAIRTVKYWLQKYKNVKTILNIALDTPEVKMCDGRWAQLYLEGMASKAMLLYRKAVLNEKLKGALSEGDADTGNRHPYNPDRVECRKNMLQALQNKALKGGVLHISDVGRKIMKCFKQAGYSQSGGQSVTNWDIDPSKMTSTDRQTLCLLWDKAKEELQRIIAEEKERALADGATLEELQMFEDVLPVIDTSGSMVSADVLAEAVSLGILCEDMSEKHNFVLPFSEQPTPVDLSKATDVVDKFRMVLNTPWGYSTDADKVNKCILDIARRAAQIHTKATGETLPVGHFLPSAVCYFTDAQFNGGYGGGMCPNLADKTLHQRACAMVKKQAPGGEMWRTIFWNLNGNSPGFPALKDSPNVQLVAGFSQSLFKLILVGSYETHVDPVTGKVTMKVDPWATFLKAISDPSLIPVLEVLSASTEGVMAHYTLPQAEE